METDNQLIFTAANMLDNYYNDELKHFSEGIPLNTSRKEVYNLLKEHMLFSILVFKNVDDKGLNRDGLNFNIDEVLGEICDAETDSETDYSTELSY